MNISKWLIVSALALAGCAPTPAQKGAEALNALNTWAQRFDAVCTGAEYRIVTDKSPCDVTRVSTEALADTTKITPEQKPVFAKFRQAITALNADFTKLLRTHGAPSANRLADLEESIFVPEDNKIAQELYDEKITWGEYLQKRKDLAARMQAATRRISPANPSGR